MKGSFFNSIAAEAVKQHKINFHSKLMYYSMLLWPVLQLYASYYSYKPFENSKTSEAIALWVGKDKVFAFILLGYIGYMFFGCFIQSAWRFSYERIYGTLELIYITPASRLGIMLGNALSSLLSSAWMFTVFCTGALLFFGDLSIKSYMLPVAVLSLTIPAICWGVFLNALFMFSRDSMMLYEIFQSPMEIFGGSKIPYAAFPLWGKLIGGVFPITWSLIIIRKIFMHGAVLSGIRNELLFVTGMCAILITAAVYLLVKAEEYARKTGNMAMF